MRSKQNWKAKGRSQQIENDKIQIKIIQHKSTQTRSNPENKLVWSITEDVVKQCRDEPSNNTLPKRTRERRRAETLKATSLIHGATCVPASHVSPAINGMWDTIISSCNNEVVAGLIRNSKVPLKNAVQNKLHDEWAIKCEHSKENILRSVNLYNSHDVMGKRKYISIRKETSNARFEGKKIPNYVTYDSLMNYVKSVDIGTLYDVRETFCQGIPEDEKGDGKFRRLTDFLPRLAEFYFKVNENRVDKLKEFKSFSKLNAEACLFLLAFGGDGAPCKEGTATSFLVSFLNVGERISSSTENFLTFGSNVKENGVVTRKYLEATLQELKEIESKTFTINVNGSNKLVEFQLAEMPNDMKMPAFLAGELSNSAFYFSSFANVNQKDSNDVSKCISENNNKQWQPFTYDKRLSDAAKVKKRKLELDGTNLQPTTKRQKVTQLMSSLKSRQEFEPLLGKAIEWGKPEPLHLKNTSVCEQFMKLLKLSLSQSRISPSVKAFSDLQTTLLFVKFVEFVHHVMTLKYLSDKIKSWFSETKRKTLSSDLEEKSHLNISNIFLF